MPPICDPSVERLLRDTAAAAGDRHLVKDAPLLAAMREFVTTGDERWLKAAAASQPTLVYWWQQSGLFDALAAPDRLELADRRLLAFAHAAGLAGCVKGWLEKYFSADDARSDGFARFVGEATPLGWTPDEVAILWANMVCHNRYRDTAGTRWQWFLALDEAARQTVLRSVLGAHHEDGSLLVQCADSAPASLRRFLDDSPQLAVRVMHLRPHWTQIVRDHADLFETDAIRALDAATAEPAHERFALAHALYQVSPARHRGVAVKTARETLDFPHGRMGDAARWLAETIGADILPEFVEHVRRPALIDFERRTLLEAAATLGRAAHETVCNAYLEGAPIEERLTPIQLLLAWDEPATRDRALAAIVTGLSVPKNSQRVRYIGLIVPWMLPALEPHLCKLFADPSRPTREAAAAVLAQIGAGVVPLAAGLLVARRAATRLAAVSLLARLSEGAGMEEAHAALRARLDAEPDETVRDAILQALPAAVAGGSEPATPESIDALVARTADLYNRLPVDWLDEASLPPLFLTGAAEPLPPAAVRFLLHRQARGKEIAADAQARPLLDGIDRGRSGNFALAVLDGFLATGHTAGDRWALAVAGLLGDGRVLRRLVRQIPEWVDHSRGKLAEFAAEAIALLGTDEALLALDALSIRYRAKNKNVGAAATAAFTRAAEARGLTTDELGDRVVPWLGFPPEGGPRVVAAGDRRVEVRVGTDFKLSLLDADTRKKIAAWPAATPPETRAEMKEMAAALREAAKAQVLRMENQFVRQRRWPVARWRELFLVHPLLLPFVGQLVWGEYAAAAGPAPPRTTFRALPDGTLTDTNDDTPTLGQEGFIGIVHPLELDAETLATWRNHLDDYEVEAPFSQLQRAVVRVAPGQAGDRSFDAANGAAVNAFTFKSRTEKRDWTRGSVVDGGGVYFYVKRFPGAGVDAILYLDGMYVAAGMDDTVTLQLIRFVRAGSVRTAGYAYDAPGDDQDERIVALGDVPPVVFSETAGDVKVIAGRSH